MPRTYADGGKPIIVRKVMRAKLKARRAADHRAIGQGNKDRVKFVRIAGQLLFWGRNVATFRRCHASSP